MLNYIEILNYLDIEPIQCSIQLPSYVRIIDKNYVLSRSRVLCNFNVFCGIVKSF